MWVGRRTVERPSASLRISGDHDVEGSGELNMAGSRGRWLSRNLSVASILQPKAVAQAVFHPAWIPPAVDPSVERLKRVRVIAGAVAAFGVYTFVEGKFDFNEVLENIVVAALVLLFITPLTVGVMLFVWRRTGRIRELRGVPVQLAQAAAALHRHGRRDGAAVAAVDPARHHLDGGARPAGDVDHRHADVRGRAAVRELLRFRRRAPRPAGAARHRDDLADGPSGPGHR